MATEMRQGLISMPVLATTPMPGELPGELPGEGSEATLALRGEHFGPRCLQDASKMPPRCLQEANRAHVLDFRFVVFFESPRGVKYISQVGISRGQVSPKMTPDGAQDGPKRPTWLQDGSKTAQDGQDSPMISPRQPKIITLVTSCLQILF